jgi:hypothetical protein
MLFVMFLLGLFLGAAGMIAIVAQEEKKNRRL